MAVPEETFLRNTMNRIGMLKAKKVRRGIKIVRMEIQIV